MLERIIERCLFASRWILAPVYLGMSLVLASLAYKFFVEVYHLIGHVNLQTETEFILVVLGLVDMLLVGGLLIMVMFSSYENFVSQIDGVGDKEKLGWLGQLDAGTLKLKVAASIVAISSIHLLKKFMDIDSIPNDKLLWYVIMHLTFVISAVLMSVLDKISFASHREHN